MAQTKKSKVTARSLLSLLILAVLGVLAWWLYNRNVPKFARYPEFGIDIPYNFTIHGIDVSKYQRDIDWAEVKAMNVDNIQIGFTFIKATEGLGNVDGYFKQNWRDAKKAEVIRGAYHFFLATKSGKAQAENFINTVQLETGDLPPVLDVEQAYGVSGDKVRQRVKEFLDTIHEYYGVMPIIYTNVDFYNQYLKNDFDDYPLWVAHYLQKDKPRITREWTFWQHSESGHINGIANRVDFNVFNGDSSEFMKLLIE
ncbi:glycoside hydrolase family 25 protein [Pinibacter aurantiacus]|uniref:Glycoside hydrolase family 25 protein n=1 Tax=Pinibacter aurantiacus TaxID=2851599 RepID=A0A9E2S8C9_9BACT|nr:GH25 family lysozyme [Pinibacter aurantiacus]MBV4357761.1 glycoside hydrolase family 25 protein [Pinibacter aurantiacus]MDH7463582.1 GH25 family lysozyme [Chitinophagaceae bacterium 26-R-25]